MLVDLTSPKLHCINLHFKSLVTQFFKRVGIGQRNPLSPEVGEKNPPLRTRFPGVNWNRLCGSIRMHRADRGYCWIFSLNAPERKTNVNTCMDNSNIPADLIISFSGVVFVKYPITFSIKHTMTL